MNTLAIDCSSRNIIIYFNISEQIFSFVQDKSKLSNLTVALPNIFNDFIVKNDISLNNLNLIINSAGPGSFTGLRISLSFIKGLSMGLSVPFLNISTLDVFAQSVHTNLDVLVLNDNISGRYYFAHYKNFEIVDKVKDLSEFELFNYIDKNIEKGVIVGNSMKKVCQAFKNKLDIFEDILKFGEILTSLGVKKYLGNNKGDSVLSSPFYVRVSDVENKL